MFKHIVEPFCNGEKCNMCGKEATHKVEESFCRERHPYTAYLCCKCFGRVMGISAKRWCTNAKKVEANSGGFT